MAAAPGAPAANRLARLAGIFHLATLPVGYFSLVYVPRVLERGLDAAPPASLARLLRLGVAADVVGEVFFAIAVVLLFELLRPLGGRLATFMLTLALIGVPMACLSEVPQLAAAQAITSDGGIGAMMGLGRELVTRLLGLRADGLQLSELFWGLWLIPAAILFYRTRLIPRVIPMLLGVTAAAYLLDWSFSLLQPDLDLPFHHLFTFELTLPLWLTVRGIDRDRWLAGVDLAQAGT